MRAPSEAVTHDGTPYPASSAIRDWAKASDESAIAVVVLVCSVFFGVVVGVGAGLAVVGVGWGDPFGGAAGVFSGFPADGGEQAVMRAAGEGEVVDVGRSAVGHPFADVVHLAQVAGHVAVWVAAAAVGGV